MQPKLRWNARILEMYFHLSTEIADMQPTSTREMKLAAVINSAFRALASDIVISSINIAKGGLKITGKHFNMSL